MKDLGTLGGDASTAYGVNERGQAVGNSSIEGWGARHACLWDGGRAIDLNPPGAGGSHANAINNQGLIAGYYSAPNFRLRACIWRDGAMVDLGFPEDSTSMALAVNDRGQVVGYCQPDLPTMCGFLWENGSLVDVGPCVQNPASALATGINNRGQVVNIRSYGPLPFLWDSGSMTDLTLVPYAINNLTVVAGAFIASDGRYHPGLWVDGTLTDLGNGLGFGGLARAVNDLGDAVGFAWRQADQRQGMRPFLWTTR